MKLLVTQKPRDYYCCQSVLRTDALKPGQLSIFTASYIGPVITLFGLYLSKSSKNSTVKFEWQCVGKSGAGPTICLTPTPSPTPSLSLRLFEDFKS